jgi:hypothetical protein
MRKTIMIAATLISFAVPVLPAASDPPDWAPAHGRRDKEHYRDDDRHYDRERDHGRERDHDRGHGYVMTREDRIYRGDDGHYRCHRKDGTVGLVVGAAVGGIVGNKLTDGGTLGTILGAGAGALLGKEIDGGGLRCE